MSKEEMEGKLTISGQTAEDPFGDESPFDFSNSI